MQLNQLKRTHKNKDEKRVARGGKRGKTAGRGTKGQKARAGHRLRPEMRDIIKKYPKLRGRGKNTNKSFEVKSAPVNLSLIELHFKDGGVVTPEVLLSKKLISRFGGRIPKVKILGTGKVTAKVDVSGCLFSESAKKAIEAAGGTVK
jgi:large subunit ribosomal protein L15